MAKGLNPFLIMHLQIIVAFAMLLWWPETPPRDLWLTHPVWCPILAWAVPVTCVFLGQLLSKRTQIRLRTKGSRVSAALNAFHRQTGLLRLIMLAGLAGTLFFTACPQILMSQTYISVLSGLPQMCLLLPYMVGLIGLWWVIHPVEKASRDAGFLGSTSTRLEYVLFNVRHQLLIVAIPLTFIVFAYAATHENRAWFVKHTGSPWAPEAILGLTATILFILSPLLLRYIWSTKSLPPGPLRHKLEALCERIDLRVRDILVWNSDGQMVNAAVMGLFPQLRYILLSDTLIEKMNDEEIESVFGHEAGHIYHHHIPFFLLFAFASMLIVSGVMEFLTRMSTGMRPVWDLNRDTIQFIGMGSLVPLWGICFGWISRRFERQADVYGAWCASPHESAGDCPNACAVHNESDSPTPRGKGVCATGARVFVGALRKVAILNGIPPEEPSWRHSSIASRMAFLTAQSGDPMLAGRFASRIRTIKRTLLTCCTIGVVIAAVYIWNQPRYRQDVIRSIFQPIGRLIGR